MNDPEKRECIICFKNLTRAFNPPNRPKDCECQFVVHKSCYQVWLKTKNASYSCLICRHTVPGRDIQVQQEPEIEVVNIDARLLMNLILIIVLLVIIIFSPF